MLEVPRVLITAGARRRADGRGRARAARSNRASANGGGEQVGAGRKASGRSWAAQAGTCRPWRSTDAAMQNRSGHIFKSANRCLAARFSQTKKRMPVAPTITNAAALADQLASKIFWAVLLCLSEEHTRGHSPTRLEFAYKPQRVARMPTLLSGGSPKAIFLQDMRCRSAP